MRIGIARYPDHGKTAIQLLQAAQAALEQAQFQSQQLAVYAPGVDLFSKRRLMLMGELRKAIQTNALELFYQPQIDLLNRSVRGVEALIRWNHPQLGFIPPDEFIPLAEHTGVIRPLTRWVLNQAIFQCAEFLSAGKPLRMSINMSARNMQEEDIADYIDKLIQRHEIPVEMVILEITESAMMTEPEKTLGVLNVLKERGISFSIDDFGTGHSSLAYIKKLPIGEIKIDRSFVMDMLQDREDLMIVHATIELGHNLGLEVVAEGVETQQEWDQLRDLGCDVGQGYFFGRPLSRDNFYEWLSAGGWSCTLSDTVESTV
jgi:EAL domain-containing protein (putative c-di-GMP-specific phosphodiesterase class I)